MAKVIIKKLTGKQVESMGINDWPIWEKEVSRFDWEYHGDEHCLILEGEVVVETDEGTYHIREGDYVTFMDGLKCIWDIRKDIRKHYRFD